MRKSIWGRIIAVVLATLMLMTLFPANAVTLAGDPEDSTASELAELRETHASAESHELHSEQPGTRQDLSELSTVPGFSTLPDIETLSNPESGSATAPAPEPLPAAYVKESSGQKNAVDFDIRVGREFIVLRENTFMFSTVANYFRISGPVRDVYSSNEETISVEQVGNDWQITVLNRFSGDEFINFTVSGNPTGFEIECGNAYGYVSRTWSDGQIVARTEYAWNPTDIEDAGGVLTDGCYISKSSENNIDRRIEVRGDAKLILLDGSKMNAGKGIYIAEGKTLQIFGGPDDSGELYSHPGSGAGIGNGDSIAHSLLISGGTLDIKGGSGCAGIGSGGSALCGITYVVINGGNVTAEGGSGGAGIGKGSGPDNGLLMDVAINGGTVTAEGGSNGAGIGGGARSDSGPVAINGGKVTVRAGQNGAGIGGGANGHQYSPVTITGGAAAQGASGSVILRDRYSISKRGNSS